MKLPAWTALAIVASLCVGVPLHACVAQELPTREESRRFTEIRGALVRSPASDSATARAIRDALNQYKSEYPQSLYLPDVLELELRTLARMSDSCDEMLEVGATLATVDPTRSLTFAEALVDAKCLSGSVRTALQTYPLTTDAPSDRVAQYYRLLTRSFLGEGDATSAQRAAEIGMEYLSQRASVDCNRYLLEFVSSATDATVEASTIISELALGGECASRIARLPDTRDRPVRHFVFFGLDRSRFDEPAFLETAAIAGAQLKYTWRELEPERGRYDFSQISSDLAFLERHGKALFIQLQDVSFDSTVVNVPDYLLDDPTFGGGVALKYEFEDDDESRPIVDGWVARRWDPAVRNRMVELLLELAQTFDGRIAGINLAETSVGFGESGVFHPPGFTCEGYRDRIVELMSVMREAFVESDVIVYANFMPGESLPENDRGYLKSIYAHADRIGAGVGGPDLLPHRWFQRQHSLPLIAGRAPGTIAGLAVQDGNLADVNRTIGATVTVDELAKYARDELHLDYLFWGTEEPYFSDAVIPYLQTVTDLPQDW